VTVWDAETGRELVTFERHNWTIQGLAFSPNGRLIASSATDGLRLWEAGTGRELFLLHGYPCDVGSPEFSPDGRRLTGTHKGSKLTWDLETGRDLPTPVDRAGPSRSARSPDGRFVAVADLDGSVRIKSPETGAEIAVLRGHAGRITDLAFATTGRRLLSAGSDQSARVWDVGTWREVATLRNTAYLGVFSPDGLLLSFGQPAGDREIRNVQTGRPIATFRSEVGSLGGGWNSPDGRCLVTATDGGLVRIWDARQGIPPALLGRGRLAGIGDRARFLPNGRLITFGDELAAARIWDVESRRELAALRGQARVKVLAVSPDGRRLATASAEDPTPRVWDVRTGRTLAILRAETKRQASRPVLSLAFSPDSRRVATDGIDGMARVWDAETGKLLATLEEFKLSHVLVGIAAIAFSPDGQRVATGTPRGSVRIWDATTGKMLRAVQGVIATPGQGALRYLDATTGKEVASPENVEGITSLAFVLEGRGLAMSGEGGGAKVWDTETGREIATFRGHTDRIQALAVSSDGRRLATASNDRTARLWDAATGRSLATLRGHTGEVHAVAFLPDGSRLISAGMDQTVRIWDIGTGRELVSLRTRAETRDTPSLAISANERHLAVGGRTWTAVESTPARLARREALGLAAFWAEHADSVADLRARIEGDPTVTEEVRAIALGETAATWEAHVRDQVEDTFLTAVQRSRPLLREDLAVAIRDDPGLAAELRPAALRLAETWPEPREAILHAAWEIVKGPGASDQEYRRALRLAERAAALYRESGLYSELPYPPVFFGGWPLNLLGIALYRGGSYPEARDSLERSRAISKQSQRDMEPVEMAFLAMTEHRLGRREAARKTLADLRTTLASKKPPYELFIPYLREAALLIEGYPSTLPNDVFARPLPAGGRRP
jgi:WD40 repeat protein